MGQFEVLQRTKDGMFNATALIRQWNEYVNSNRGNSPCSTLCTQKNGYPKERLLDNFWKTSNLDQLMSEIALNELNFKSVDFTELKNVLSKTSKGKDGGTWMHPILFVKFAMWLNPRFEYHVLKFVADQMIKYRNDAGDAYRELGSAVQKIVDRSWMPIAMKNIAKALNFIVFGNHGREMRNKQGDEVKMRELFELERQIALLVNDGFLKNYNALIEYLRRKWKDKYLPSVLRS